MLKFTPKKILSIWFEDHDMTLERQISGFGFDPQKNWIRVRPDKVTALIDKRNFESIG